MTEPRKPADRKPKAATVEPERPLGWDLLKPFSDVPVWDQTELVEIVKPLTRTAEKRSEDDGEGGEVDVMDFDSRIVGQLAKVLGERFVLPGREDDYRQLVSGRGALERAINLGVAYVDQLGESEPSTTG